MDVPPGEAWQARAPSPWCPGKLVTADGETLKSLTVVGNEQGPGGRRDFFASRTNSSALTVKGRSNM